uniref:Uncharacterized protein n=1 Tax=Oryzias latipes TaxID=8090 RepID=A0A3P9HQW3_ORYLA
PFPEAAAGCGQTYQEGGTDPGEGGHCSQVGRLLQDLQLVLPDLGHLLLEGHLPGVELQHFDAVSCYRCPVIVYIQDTCNRCPTPVTEACYRCGTPVTGFCNRCPTPVTEACYRCPVIVYIQDTCYRCLTTAASASLCTPLTP